MGAQVFLAEGGLAKPHFDLHQSHLCFPLQLNLEP